MWLEGHGSWPAGGLRQSHDWCIVFLCEFHRAVLERGAFDEIVLSPLAFDVAEGTQTVAAPRCLPSRMGCNSGERKVMGDFYRHRRVMRAGWHIVQCSYSACFPFRRGEESDPCVAKAPLADASKFAFFVKKSSKSAWRNVVGCHFSGLQFRRFQLRGRGTTLQTFVQRVLPCVQLMVNPFSDEKQIVNIKTRTTQAFVGRLTRSSDADHMDPCAPVLSHLLREEGQRGAARHLQDLTELPFLEPDTRFLVLMKMFWASSWLEPL